MSKQLKSGSLENLFVNETHRAVYAEISSLKKRIHLLEGERKAHYQLNEETLKRNEARIHELRSENQRLKKERENFSKSQLDNYFQLIANFFGSKKPAFEFRGKNSEETKDILDCKVGDVQNKLNLLAFEKKRIQLKMKEMIEKEEKLQKILNQNGERNRKSDDRLDEIKSIENKIGEMKIKVIEGENLQTRYKNMTTTLTNSNLSKSLKLTQTEGEIMQQSKDIERLGQALSEAVKVKKEAKVRLVEMEQESFAEYATHEQSLFEARIKLKDIRERTEAIGAKLIYPKFHMIHRDSSLTGGLIVGFDGTRLLTTDEMKSTSSNEIEKVYNQLQEMTGESEPIQIVRHFQEQREHSKELAAQLQEAMSYIRKCKLRKRFLEDKLSSLQFSGGQERQVLDDEYGILKNQFDKLQEKKVVATKSIENNKFIMDEILDKLDSLCVIVDFKLPDTVDMTTSEQVIQILNMIYNQIQEVLQQREIEISLATPLVSPVETERDGTFSDHESCISIAMSTTAGQMDNYFFATDNFEQLRLSTSTADLTKLSRPGSAYQRTPDLQISHMDSAAVSAIAMGGIERSPTPKSRRSESSEDEEAIGRNYIKKQSQVLVEAKTRKGRFNAAVSMNARKY